MTNVFTDSFGATWGIDYNKRNNLYEIVKEQDDEWVKPTAFPKGSNLGGSYTKPTYAEEAIKLWVAKSVTFAEEAKRQAERKKQAAKAAKEEAKVDETTS